MNISLEFSLDKKDKLYNFLKEKGFSFQNINYAFFKAVNNGVSLILYKSGRLLIQGKEVDDIYRLIRSTFFPPSKAPWMGTDETGKGDYFGPLVVAGVVMTPELEDDFLRLGMRDSKKIGSNKIKEFAKIIENELLHSVIIIYPKQYNALYKEKKNLNTILAEAHINVINSILQKKAVKKVVVDRFAKNSGIASYFGNRIHVEEIPGGEADLACASASILARSVFEKEMDEMSKKYEFRFPKGAGLPVKRAIKEFLERYPLAELKNVAKLHFKLTDEVLNG